jgi:RimJ/RimL family protein N-acetyltransferase
MEIRPARPTDAPLLRELRLRALRDSPDSFGPTFEQAAAEPEEYWERWAGGADGRFHVFLAFDGDGAPLGLVSGSVRQPGLGGFGALWVSPAARGSGLGRRLVETVCTRLEELGCRRITLSVTDGNPAERLYESLGFARTGERHPLRDGSPLFEVTMARESSPRVRSPITS